MFRGRAMKRLPQSHANFKIHRERDKSALSRLAMLLFCGVGLTGGFLFAAKQHFAAIQYGYKTEELRREQGRLLREEQLLLLEREQASSPGRLEPAARALGLRPLQPVQIASKPGVQVEAHQATIVGSAAALPR